MKEIKLTQGKVALVDDDDYETLNRFKWAAAKTYKTYYAVRRDGRKNVYMHRILLGDIKGFIIDHIDRNGLNNMRSNLRHATHSENMQNRRTNGKSKYHGVVPYWVEHKYKYYRAMISKNRNRIYIGSFYTEEAAALAYDRVARLYYGDNAHTNFSD